MASSAAAAPSRAASAPQRLAVSIESKPASVAFDAHLFWLSRGAAEAHSDAASAYLCIPPQLLLHASFVADSDGGSLLLRLLSPPLGAASSSLLLRKSASRASLVAALCAKQQAAAPSDQSDAARDAAHLLEQLEGPCANLRLITIEARVAASASGGAASWAAQLSALAYAHVAPFRRLKVLLNPIGGPGKARVLFAQRIRPILEAAGCVLDVEVTRRAFHGTEIARAVDIDAFDGIVCVSGDGMLHEVLNGLASRADARAALRKLFVAPIPTGSGNGVAVNILGAQEGFNLALACLNVIKGRAMEIDVCSVTQPRVEMPKRKGKPGPNGVAVTQEAQEMKPYTHVYSFLSQAIGLMADIDLGTEHMRALGDARFVIGYIGGVLANKECEVDVYVKLGEQGTLNRDEMRRRMLDASKEPAWSSGGDADAQQGDEAPPLRHGAVTETLRDAHGEPLELSSLPELSLHDPSWPYSVASSSSSSPPSSPSASSSWHRIPASISALYAGKLPYVGRDLLQFPFAAPGDGLVDVALTLHGGGRAAKLRAINGAETGNVVYDAALAYLKCEAYRVVPRRKAGDKSLKKGGLISIDGEHSPYVPFQVEVASSLQLRVLSLFGHFVVPPLAVPTPPGSAAPRA